RRNILSNGNSYAIYATAIRPTRSGKNLATLRPLSRNTFILSRSVTIITYPSNTNILRISYYESL
ncbi:hypothetical protein BR93DRAFT_991841, partial [Coniochaeta sp. PMI_546]